MSDTQDSQDGGHAEGTSRSPKEHEALALAEAFNNAAEDHSPDLEWFAMSNGLGEEAFVFEVVSYADPDGLDALRDLGRSISYIEVHAPPDGDDACVSIHVPVQGEVPEVLES